MAEIPQAPLSEGKTIGANGLEIYYREWGTGRPLILLHGATDTHKFWDPFIPAFRKRYRVVTPDNRGHGWTINPEPALLTYPMMADDLAGLIKALDLESPYVFGYSDGGQAALELGIRYPDLAGALVVGGVWFQFSQSYQDAIRRSGFISPDEVDYEIYEKQAPEDWEERLRKAHHDTRQDYPRILLSALARLWWTPLAYTDQDLQKITSPVMVLVGAQDEAIPVKEAQELAGKIPRAELAVIPDAGHNEVIVKGGVFLGLVLDFLERQAL
jgi:pimeloyl-ACP methyl ester carboxylesterase